MFYVKPVQTPHPKKDKAGGVGMSWRNDPCAAFAEAKQIAQW
jgi:hypothetical protein